jgi:hypothetical protein
VSTSDTKPRKIKKYTREVVLLLYNIRCGLCGHHLNTKLRIYRGGWMDEVCTGMGKEDGSMGSPDKEDWFFGSLGKEDRFVESPVSISSSG